MLLKKHKVVQRSKFLQEYFTFLDKVNHFLKGGVALEEALILAFTEMSEAG